MTTQTTLNNKIINWDLSEMEISLRLKADLIERGWDGTTWKGESIPSGRQVKRAGVFYRKPSGEFVCALQSRA